MSDGTVVPVLPTWSSSNPMVLTTDANGIVTAISVGQAIVTATVGSRYASRAIIIIQPSTGTSDALIVEEFSMIEFQYPGSTDWQYAPQIRVRAATDRSVTILSIGFSIPGLDPIPSVSCTAPVPALSSELNGDVFGEWSFFISASERATSEEVLAIITYVDDGIVTATKTVKGLIVAGGLPTGGNGGVCHRGFNAPG